MATGSSTLVKVDSDGGLVLATLAGDSAAFAQLYDRFSVRIHDLHLALLNDPDEAGLATYHTFRTAVADLNRLGEPSALRPWLYKRAYQHAKKAKTATLGQPDQALLTLHLRHGLAPAELSQILGMTERRVTDRLAILLPGRPPHSQTTPLTKPPPALREQVLSDISLLSAHQGLPRPRGRSAWIGTVTAIVVILVGTTLLVHRGLERRPVYPVRFGPASELTLSTTVIDLGATASTATITLSNTGKRMLAWQVTPTDAWMTVSPSAGVLPGGQARQLTVTADRAELPEGDGRTELRFESTDDQGRGEVAVALREERPPTISNPRAVSARIGGYGCPTSTEIRATITDESPPLHVVLIGPGSRSQVMKADGNSYTGRLGSGSHANIVWRIVATDSRNNTATSPAHVIVSADCAARPVPKKPEHPPASRVSEPQGEHTPAANSTGEDNAENDNHESGTGGGG